MRTSVFTRALASVGALLIATVVVATRSESASSPVTEAVTGFDGLSNGFAEEFCLKQKTTKTRLANSPNSPTIPDDECEFDLAAEEFTGPETPDDGLGPIFNAAGCGECHMVPTLGGSSQIVEKRAGFFDGTTFFDHPGGSLIQDRAILPAVQELTKTSWTLPNGARAHANVQALRASLTVLGDGFVEAISEDTLKMIADSQDGSVKGRRILVPVFEMPGAKRTGRFGWKDQQASLVSFSADAYVNEMGITSPLQPDEPTSNGEPVNDPVPGTDDEGVDVELFALFMRSTKAPPRDLRRAATEDARDGRRIFETGGSSSCATCHTPTITTAPPGTLINGGALKVADTLGNKVIHPFSDFLLHDVDTGDGIVQNGGAASRNMVRTVPLWGLRTRGRFMHDGLSFNLTDAILRHGNQAQKARERFSGLSSRDKNKLIAFLLSL